MDRRASRHRSVALLWPAAGILALALAAGSPDVRTLLVGALARVRLVAVLAALPGQAGASLLCGMALFLLRPGVSFPASLLSRLLRDAGANLLLFMPGIGEMIGARALVLAGGRTRAAITASVLDNLAETLAQLPFAVLSVLVLWQIWPPINFLSAAARALLWIAAVAALLLALLLGFALSPSVRKATRRLAACAAAELPLLRDELRKQQRGFPAAFALHCCAWAMGGVQLWMVADALSFRLGLFPAIVMESVAYAARGAAFFIPAGLAVQEAALVVAGLAYGLSPAQSLAIALILRLRDLVFGLPLLAWPFFELRRAALNVTR